MPKQRGTADAERIAMTTDEKLERFRQMRSMTEDERTALEIQNINKILLTVSSAERAEVMIALTRRKRASFLGPYFSRTGRTATTLGICGMTCEGSFNDLKMKRPEYNFCPSKHEPSTMS